MKKLLILFSILITAFYFAQLTNGENYTYRKECLNNDCSKNSETVRYFDGLGRPKQVVEVKASPTGKDVVTHIEYDAFGRSVKDFLPIPQASTQNGAIYGSPLGNASAIYGNEKIYLEKIVENSPLDRIKQQIQVGNDWAGKPVKFGYNANVDGEVRKLFTTTTFVNNATKSTIENGGTYATGQLYKNTITDEDGNQTIEFKNGKGQLILSRKPLNPENADTYYVYNEYDQLAWVIPPKLSKMQSWGIAEQDALAYEYRYDKKYRLVEKKLPGKGWEYMVYDKADRLVLTQDANLRAKGQWLFTKYDQLSRPIYTGILDSPPGTVAQANAIEGHGINNEMRTASSWNNNGMDIFYTSSNAYPATNFKLLSINYYDTYPVYGFNPTFPSTIQGESVLSDTPSADGRSTKGLPVMSLLKNIEDDNWTKNYTYYDTKGRAVGSHSINHLGGYTKTESKLDFTGVPQTVVTRHKRLNSDTERIITENFEYDNQNRLLVHKHQVDSNPVEILTQNNYNELSQLSNKKVGNNLQSIDYAYNIRGWMTQINDPANLNGKLFGYAIRYNNPINTPYAPARYNGNIAEVDWRTPNDNILKRYSYSYYTQNRLMFGHYSEPLATVPENSLYDEYFEYDLSGNIAVLSRNSKNPNSGFAVGIDVLKYTYAGNRLLTVKDATQNKTGYPIGGNTIEYDDNGNMTKHLDKKISNIKYNFLNLPIAVQGNEKYTYVYRSDGIKIRKNRVELNTISSTDYLDGFQYFFNTVDVKKVQLQFVPTSEGYFDYVKNKYIYNYTDHLGNIRVSYTNNGSGAQIIEENNYYPFGLKHDGGNTAVGNYAYNYKFLGNELQETGWYDMNARFYMPDLGRFGQHDPLSDFTFDPYGYAFGNPISLADPFGTSPVDWNETGSLFGNGDGPGIPKNSIGGSNNPYQIPEIMLNAPIRAMASNPGSVMPSYCSVCYSGNGTSSGINLSVPQIQNVQPTFTYRGPENGQSGGVVMMDSMVWDLVGIVLANNISAENQEAALGLGALAIVLSKGRAADEVAKAEAAIAKSEIGAFSVADWTNYPAAIPKPTGPFKILEGAEYEAARKAANNANQALRRANPEAYKGLEIHEIHPVKYGGSAIDPANKIAIPRDYHRKVVTPWWNDNMRSIKKIP